MMIMSLWYLIESITRLSIERLQDLPVKSSHTSATVSYANLLPLWHLTQLKLSCDLAIQDRASLQPQHDFPDCL